MLHRQHGATRTLAAENRLHSSFQDDVGDQGAGAFLFIQLLITRVRFLSGVSDVPTRNGGSTLAILLRSFTLTGTEIATGTADADWLN